MVIEFRIIVHFSWTRERRNGVIDNFRVNWWIYFIIVNFRGKISFEVSRPNSCAYEYKERKREIAGENGEFAWLSDSICIFRVLDIYDKMYKIQTCKAWANAREIVFFFFAFCSVLFAIISMVELRLTLPNNTLAYSIVFTDEWHSFNERLSLSSSSLSLFSSVLAVSPLIWRFEWLLHSTR